MKTLPLVLGSVLFFNLHLAESKADEPIVSGEVKSGTLSPGSTQRYYFDAVVGAGIMAAMGDVDRVYDFRPQISVYGPDGALLGTQWGYDRASVRVTATMGGTHYVVASAYGDSLGGAFQSVGGTLSRHTGERS